jgi:hypothetical protein
VASGVGNDGYRGGARFSARANPGQGGVSPPSEPGGGWTETILYSFAGGTADGDGPQNLAMGGDGSLYGPTYGGSGSCDPDGCGTVFRLAPPSSPGGQWQEIIIS